MKSSKILIVDDEKDIAELGKIVLESAGMDVAICTESESIIYAIEEFKPDAILLDVNLDHVFGFQIYNEIRINPKFDKISILFLTSFRPEKVPILKQLPYLSKPFGKQELIENVQKLLISKPYLGIIDHFEILEGNG